MHKWPNRQTTLPHLQRMYRANICIHQWVNTIHIYIYIYIHQVRTLPKRRQAVMVAGIFQLTISSSSPPPPNSSSSLIFLAIANYNVITYRVISITEHVFFSFSVWSHQFNVHVSIRWKMGCWSFRLKQVKNSNIFFSFQVFCDITIRTYKNKT